MGSPLDDPRLTLAGLFFEAHAGVAANLERRLEREIGLSLSSFEVLLRLGRSPEHRLRMSELAAQVMLSSSGLTRAVDRLVSAGLVERVSCDSDRRGQWAQLTTDGVQRIEAAVALHLDHLDEVFTGLLDADQRQGLESALRVLRDNLNPCALVGTEVQPAAKGSAS